VTGRRSGWLLMLLLAGVGAGRELLYNGDFELVPDSGWQVERWGEFPDTGNCRLRWRHDLAPDRDFEVLVHKMLHEGMRLSQRVDVATLDLEFQAHCRLTAKTERETLFAAAGVCVEYLNRDDSVLGESRIYAATSGCDWQSGPRLHLIRAPDSLNWHRYRFGVRDELANLPGVAPDSVRAIRVSLLGYVKGNC